MAKLHDDIQDDFTRKNPLSVLDVQSINLKFKMQKLYMSTLLNYCWLHKALMPPVGLINMNPFMLLAFIY